MEGNVSFSNVGPLTFLDPGRTAFWNYTYGPDHGTQLATADIKTPDQGAVHLADQQRKVLDNNKNATYFVNITTKVPAAVSTTFKAEEWSNEDDHCHGQPGQSGGRRLGPCTFGKTRRFGG
jgi:hypothetical protein